MKHLKAFENFLIETILSNDDYREQSSDLIDFIRDVIDISMEDDKIEYHLTRFDLMRKELLDTRYIVVQKRFITLYGSISNADLIEVKSNSAWICDCVTLEVLVDNQTNIKDYIEQKFSRVIKSYPNTLIYSRLEGVSMRPKDNSLTGYRIVFLLNPIYDMIQESNFVSNTTNLIIVDVQKSFRKFFTEMYVNQLQKYAKQFTNVYVIYDNHYQGKNVDKDYLYDEVQDELDKDEVYKFKDGQELIEKRYQYDVDADFYRKILDKETYKIVKEKEKKNQLKVGELYMTTEGTAIVYIGNNHQWYHVPKRLYELFLDLKGQVVTIVGGSNGECIRDVEVAAEAMGVIIKEDLGYIYSASYCPIK